MGIQKVQKRLQENGVVLAAVGSMLLGLGCDVISPNCKVEYEVLDDWGGGFRAGISLTQNQSDSLDSWVLEYEAPNQLQSPIVTGARWDSDGKRKTLSGFDGTFLNRGEPHEVTVAFSNQGHRPVPESFRLNGQLCEGGLFEKINWAGPMGEVISFLRLQAAPSPTTRVQDSLGSSSISESLEMGLTELDKGVARFFVQGTDWADLQVESPHTSRHHRMQTYDSGHEYLVFGLRPGDLIRFRFLLGVDGQRWTEWQEVVFSGMNSEVRRQRVPRVIETEAGGLAFEVEGHPWAEVHIKTGPTFLSQRLDPSQGLLRFELPGLAGGEQVDYRWVVGLDQPPGQYDTDWSSHIYSGGDDPQGPGPPLPISESDDDFNPPPPPSAASEDVPPLPPVTTPPVAGGTDPLELADPGEDLSSVNHDSPSTSNPEPDVDLVERFAFESDTLFLVASSADSPMAGLSFSPGDLGAFEMIPAGPESLVYRVTGLTADYDETEQASAFQIWVDGWRTGVAYVQARIKYDFEGDGVIDREERYTAGPAHAQRGLDPYGSDDFPLLESTGVFRDLRAGTVELELSNPHFTGGPQVFTDAATTEGTQSWLEIPYDFSVIEVDRSVASPSPVFFPDEVVCGSPEQDPRCGPAYNEDSLFFPPSELPSIHQNGLEAFRASGVHGACATCHVPDAFDLAVIGYSDEDIRRRALEHVSETQAEAIVRLIHAQRQSHELRRLLHPARFRPLQPGFSPLPGLTPQDRDLAFLEYLRDEVGLLLVTDRIDSREKALQAEQQLLELDLHRLRIGVRLDRWSEDEFHGLSHMGQDPLDGSGLSGQVGSVAEWLPNMAIRPDHESDFYRDFDTYAQNPTDVAFWTFYDQIGAATGSEEHVASESEKRAFEWMQTKYQAVQVVGHMLRQRTLRYPDRGIDQLYPDLISNRTTAIDRQPFWRVGDLIRQHPLNCDAPHGCMFLPEFIPNETNLQKRTLQSRILERAWFWAGWMVDPPLLTSDPSFETVSGDYFYPLHQGHWGGHYAFIMAKMSAEKANAKGWDKMAGPGVAGHGKWASIRPFLVYKHSEFQRPMFSPNDPRYLLQKRLLTNTARMWLYLVHEDLDRTGAAFDRAGTAKAINFARLNWLEGTDPTGSREDVEEIFSEIVQLLRSANEERQQHHTDDLYDYLPVADVDVD